MHRMAMAEPRAEQRVFKWFNITASVAIAQSKCRLQSRILSSKADAPIKVARYQTAFQTQTYWDIFR
jgi:hypothetical protein